MSYSLVMVKVTHDSTSLLRIFVLEISYNLSYISPIFPILSSSSHSSILPSSICSFSSSLILSNLYFLFSFHFLQFLFNCSQYSSSNLLSSHLYNIFAICLPSSSSLLSSLLFLLFLTLSILLYSSSNSFTKSSTERVQKGITYWDKQNNDVPAPNYMLKV